MERRLEYLPRLVRIAEIIADCKRARLPADMQGSLAQFCAADTSVSGKAHVRFTIKSGRLAAESGQPDAPAKVDFCLLRQ